MLHSLSGTMAISETVLKDTVLMAIDEINAKGGLLGKKLEAVVVDPASNWPLFAEKAKQLISQDKVAVVTFGCWTSVSRKSVLPVFEETQQPAVLPRAVRRRRAQQERVLHRRRAQPAGHSCGGIPDEQGRRRAKRWVLLGTDYVYPRTTNKILRAFLKSKGVAEADIMEEYTPFGHSGLPDHHRQDQEVRRRAARSTAVVSTINGDSNVPFYKELGNQGLKATDVPVVAFSVGEEELRGVDTKPLVGHLAAWNYFMSLKSPANTEFVKKWSDYAKAKGIAGHKDKPLTNDPMEATYIGFNMWAQAVDQGQEHRHRQGDRRDGRPDLQGAGRASRPSMDKRRTTTCTSRVFIGEVQADGQFKVVWKTPGAGEGRCRGATYIPENKGKKDEPVMAKK